MGKVVLDTSVIVEAAIKPGVYVICLKLGSYRSFRPSAWAAFLSFLSNVRNAVNLAAEAS